MAINSSENSVILILVAFSNNLSAENSKLSAESGLPGLSLLESMLLATLWEFLKDTLIHRSPHTHSLIKVRKEVMLFNVKFSYVSVLDCLKMQFLFH